jgi:hypothetical protein
VATVTACCQRLSLRWAETSCTMASRPRLAGILRSAVCIFRHVPEELYCGVEFPSALPRSGTKSDSQIQGLRTAERKYRRRRYSCAATRSRYVALVGRAEAAYAERDSRQSPLLLDGGLSTIGARTLLRYTRSHGRRQPRAKRQGGFVARARRWSLVKSGTLK